MSGSESMNNQKDPTNPKKAAEKTPCSISCEEVLVENKRLKIEIQEMKTAHAKAENCIRDLKQERTQLLEKFHSMKQELSDIYKQYELLEFQQQQESKYKKLLEEKDKIIRKLKNKSSQKSGSVRSSRSNNKLKLPKKNKSNELGLTLNKLEKEQIELKKLLKTGENERERTYINKMLERNLKKISEIKALQERVN